MHAFEAIDFLELVTVTGGEAPGASPTVGPDCTLFAGAPPSRPRPALAPGTGAPPPRRDR
jgi:hypothetical protein